MSPTTSDSRTASRHRGSPASTTGLAGGLLIDKPKGITSHDVVARVRRLLGERRCGHTGTLDPLATGLLVLCLGPATRLARFLSGQPKSYRASVCFGFATDTYDVTGRATSPHREGSPTKDSLEAALSGFRGVQKQVPPPFSAKKIGGRRAYRLARAGEAVHPDPVEVEILELRLLELVPPRAELEMTVSSGTYVRSLAHDLGERLGCGAHLDGLRRTRVGSFDVEDASTLEALEAMPAPAREERILSPSRLLGDFEAISPGLQAVSRLAHGLPLEAPALFPSLQGQRFVRVLDDSGALAAVAEWSKTSRLLRPVVVLRGGPEGELQGS